MASEPKRNDQTNDTAQAPERRNDRLIIFVLITGPLILMIVSLLVAFFPTSRGNVDVCDVATSTGGTLRLQIQPLTVGGIYHEAHQFLYRASDADDWQTLIEMTLPTPRPAVTCEDNLLVLGPETWVVWNGKAVSLSIDSGETWQMWEICDAPRPEFGCIAAEHIQSVTLDEVGRIVVDITAPEGDYRVLTENGGESWAMA